MDLDLPGMNGPDAIPLLAERAPEIPVVALTAFEDEDKIFPALRAGARGCLLKSRPVERIVTGLREAAGGGAPLSAGIARRVLDRFVPRDGVPRDTPPTDLERRVLEAAADGLSKKMIADRLDMNPPSVDAALRRVYSKLHVHNRGGAVAKAILKGFLPRR